MVEVRQASVSVEKKRDYDRERASRRGVRGTRYSAESRIVAEYVSVCHASGELHAKGEPLSAVLFLCKKRTFGCFGGLT